MGTSFILPKARSVFIIWSALVIIALMAVFFMFSNKASAADAGEFVFFRIDSEIDTLIADKGTLSLRFSCGGATAAAYVEDGTASESTNSADGIIKLASASKEMTDASCTVLGSQWDGSKTIRASISIDGWVARTWEVVLLASTTAEFVTRASLDYTILVNGVDDELGTAITLDGVTASATYSGTVASQSYSGGKRYIAGSTFGGTVTGGADGYVNRTSSALTISATASQSVDFGTTTDSGLDESGLSFGHKIQVWQYGSTFAITPILYGVITAGDSYGTTCSPSSGYWYCAVPLANTATVASWAGGTMQTTTTTYTDRSTGGDAQTLSIITPVSNISGGADPDPTPTPTPDASPTPTPEPGASPTPTPDASPTPTPTPSTIVTPASRGFVSLVALGLKEGDTISAAGSSDPDIYIPNIYGYKRLFLNPAIFNFYGHLGGFRNVKNATAVTRDKMVTSGLFRNCETNDPKVYGVEINGEDTGLLHWVNTTGAQAIADDANFFKKVFCINTNEFNWYSKGSNYTSVNQVPIYSR